MEEGINGKKAVNKQVLCKIATTVLITLVVLKIWLKTISCTSGDS